MSQVWLMRSDRHDGYAPLEDYALIGDGRTAALVGRDGSIDWLCLPNLDSESICGAILDAQRGGSFVVQPSVPFESSRRYLPHTNVLETTFTTDSGAVRVIDALTLPNDRLDPMRELARSIHGVSGDVPMRWQFTPRFHYGGDTAKYEWRLGIPVATCGGEAVGIASWNAGKAAWRDGTAHAEFTVREGDRALVTLTAAYGEPLVVPGHSATCARLDGTIAFWTRWATDRSVTGRWASSVERSTLLLKLLIFAPSGASVAAPTTSLPEEIGGERNWDYRYCWIRDSNFVIDALLSSDCHREARSLFWWFMQATARTVPELHVLYRLDGGLGVPERELDLEGYRRSRPVRVGNGAAGQTQLDVYGALFETALLFSAGHHALDWDTGHVLGRIADHVCDIWRQPDSGIWEVRNGPFHFTHSKAMCWVALDRACKLAKAGEVPADHVDRWQQEMAAIRAFVDDRCWSPRLGSFTRSAGSEDVDASLLMLSLLEYCHPSDARLLGTVDAVNRLLRHGDFVYRYHADDGVVGEEGCFLNCSFWLVSALARIGRVDEASALMDRLCARANDVGLFSEEVEPSSGMFLGNFPQALVHLALIDAATALGR
jgi:GH15 family glucan-1,4-alpha-glucosidase